MPDAPFPDSVFPFGQQILIRLNSGAEQMLKTAMALTAQQIEISRGLVQGGIEDLALLAHAGTPAGLLQAQVEILKRQAERSLDAVQVVAEQVTKSLTVTTEVVLKTSDPALYAPVTAGARVTARAGDHGLVTTRW